MFKKNKLPIIFMIATILTLMSACSIFDQTKQPEEAPSNTDSTPPEKDTIEEPGNKQEEQAVDLPADSLQKLDKGEQVLQLQNALNHIGYELNENGEYDEATTWAITDFQLQHDSLLVSGLYDEQTKIALDEAIDNDVEVVAGAGLPQTAEPAFTSSGTEVIANPYEQLALINKEHALPADYIPEDLVIPNVPFPFSEDTPKKQMREAAAKSLEDLFAAAEKFGLELFAISGYRSFDRQDAIFASNALKHGEEEANTFSARPGESEHQTGLSMDVTSPEVDFELVTEFENTKEGQWIQENAAEFGFIVRFPEGKEEITKYMYEPWHLRYVGEKAAKEITAQGITLEEYLGETE
ncbi:D-alanyl-D-alanine carboxypeptidase family protein [Oceanobacillus damuensis]|uniref:D-alanyl-D-alanine carboxypeptidase family protein n=1 Tax=Oceanobacillus damuensis TaxID=937928 RepID=UPI0008367DC8|nr:D-alanyl-D-alanine carboxypeptidase family protein [Oceanobacillus damuensis]